MTGSTGSLLAGLVLGFASSAHCAAMCGPLVLTVSRHLAGPSRSAQARHALVYHAGRVLVYLALALPAGLLGRTLVIGGLGRALAIGAGILLLVAAAGSIRVPLLSRISSRFSALLARASSPAFRWGRTHPLGGPLVAGAFNGLLPCGLVYAAVTTAGATGRPIAAALLMAGFGIGTSAVLVAIAVWPGSLMPLRFRLRHVSPVVLAVTAAILIARGVAMPHQHAADHHVAVNGPSDRQAGRR